MRRTHVVMMARARVAVGEDASLSPHSSARPTPLQNTTLENPRPHARAPPLDTHRRRPLPPPRPEPPPHQLGAAIKRVTDAATPRVPLIVDDRVDVALALGADGAHVGQTDLPPAAARALLGPVTTAQHDACCGWLLHAGPVEGATTFAVGS